MILRSAALAVLAVVLSAPAADARPAVVDETDPTGDVVIFDGGGIKPTTAQRNTIDLERFTATRTRDGLLLTFRIARITGSRTFDQIVTAQLHKKGRDGFDMQVLANPQHKNTTAYYDNRACLGEVRTSRKTDTVKVLVPEACLPPGAGVLRVTTYTQEKNGSGPGFSEDTMRVKGTVALG